MKMTLGAFRTEAGIRHLNGEGERFSVAARPRVIAPTPIVQAQPSPVASPVAAPMASGSAAATAQAAAAHQPATIIASASSTGAGTPGGSGIRTTIMPTSESPSISQAPPAAEKKGGLVPLLLALGAAYLLS